jgi:hypothetical protein
MKLLAHVSFGYIEVCAHGAADVLPQLASKQQACNQYDEHYLVYCQ